MSQDLTTRDVFHQIDARLGRVEDDVRTRGVAQLLQPAGGLVQGHLVTSGAGEQIVSPQVGGELGGLPETTRQSFVFERAREAQRSHSEPVR